MVFAAKKGETMAEELVVTEGRRGDQWTEFNTDRVLSTHLVGRGIGGNERVNELVAKILGIHGVQSVFVRRYCVSVKRTPAVDWELISPKVEQIIREALTSGNRA
jgi:hypothetical protein